MATAEFDPEAYSLLPKFSQWLSRHLYFHLLEFEANKAAEAGDEGAERAVLEAKLAMLEAETNMTDYVASLYEQLHGEGASPPDNRYVKRRAAVVAENSRLDQATETISGLLASDDVVNNLRSDKAANMSYLEREHGVCISGSLHVAECRGTRIKDTDMVKPGHRRHGQRTLRPRPV
jgi:translation initiation factor 3 subunit E